MVGELPRAVIQENLLRLRELDIAYESAEIGVIGERKGRLTAEAISCIRIERPTGQYGAARELSADRFGPRPPGRPEQRTSARKRRIITLVRREGNSGFYVHVGDRGDCRMDRRWDRCFPQDRDRLLRLPQGVRQEERNRVVFERPSGECDDLLLDLSARREEVARAAVRTLHQYDVATLYFGRLGGVRVLELEVARIDERAMVALDHQLSASEDVTR